MDIGRARLIPIADAVDERGQYPFHQTAAARIDQACAAPQAGRKLRLPVAALAVGALSVASWLVIAGLVVVIAACATRSPDPALSLLSEVNVAVNQTVRYVAEAGGRNDWRVAEEEGDCEDFALRKRRDLIQRGFPALDLSVLAVPGHAMLLARTQEGAYVLDNRTDRIVAWDGQGREYLPLGAMWLPRDYVLKLVKKTPDTLEMASFY